MSYIEITEATDAAKEAAQETSILNDPWFAAGCVVATLVLFAVLMIVYMPRVEEVMRLRKIIVLQHTIIDRMARESTDAAFEHIADVGELSEKYLAATREKDSISTEYEGKLAQAASRTQQHKDLADQIARAADRMTGRAIA